MTYQLVLISVLIAGGYWGPFFLRRDKRTFGLMLLGSAGLSVLGLLGESEDIRALSYAGAIGVGTCTCMLVVGPMLRSLARRLAAAEKVALAQKLLSVVEILSPGAGAGEERVLMGAMGDIREGKIEATLDALEQAKIKLPPDARLAIDERIAMLYLAAYRWDDAIAHAEKNLFGAQPGDPQSLRGVLGVAPPVWIELLGAFGRTGQLDRAAEMMAQLEDACADRPDTSYLLHRGRMVFLALAGRADLVEAMVGKSRHLTRSARAYWIAVAHEHAGEQDAAAAAYRRARGASRGRPRKLIDDAIAKLPAAKPPVVSDAARAVVERIAAAPAIVLPKQPRRGQPVTRATTAATFVVAAAIAIFLGASSDLGVLLRAGANVRGFIDHGEWWRLVSCIFIHVGWVHLLVNAIGLWFLGRLCEDLFGSARTLALFAISGVAGAVASYLASTGGVSAGASGAIFGLLGAMLIELWMHRKRHVGAWQQGMFGSVVVVTIAQIAVGFAYPAIDQWAHGAGLVAGALGAALLSPHARFAKAGLQVARVIGAAFVAVCVVAAVQVVRTPLGVSLAREPLVEHHNGAITVSAPARWTDNGDGIADPDGVIILDIRQQELGAWTASEPARAKQRGFDEIHAHAPTFALPAGWQGSELELSFEDPMGYRQIYRAIVCGNGTLVASLYAPASVIDAAPDYLRNLIASIR